MRRLTGYFLAAIAFWLSEAGHQLIHAAEWCLDHDGRADCPNCIREP